MAKEPREIRESAAQKIDREWRELANDSIDDLRIQVTEFKEFFVGKLHEMDKDIALMKLKLGLIAAGFGFLGSVVTTVVAKYIMKS